MRDAGSRVLGRLGGDQKNQELNMEFALLAAPETPLFGTPYADFLRDFAISLIFKKCKKEPYSMVGSGRPDRGPVIGEYIPLLNSEG